MKTKNMIIILITLSSLGFFLMAILNYEKVQEDFNEWILSDVPFRGEPCEEPEDITFRFDRTNITDRIEKERAYMKYKTENEIKGYCEDGKRIGGLR